MLHGQGKKEVIVFRYNLAGGQKVTLKERIKADCTIVEVRVRFYPGQENSLKVRPYILHKLNKPEEIFTYVEGGSVFLSGDDDRESYPVSLSAQYDDEVVVYAENTSIYEYTVAVDVVVDYDSGQFRGVGA
jgi:3-dehydroquinate dehydratase